MKYRRSWRSRLFETGATGQLSCIRSHISGGAVDDYRLTCFKLGRSNSASHAVTAITGTEAASTWVSEFGLFETRNAFSPCHARDGYDDSRRAEAEFFPKLPRRRALDQSPPESFKIDPPITRPFFPVHMVGVEEDLIVMYFEDRGGGRLGRRTIERTQYRTS